MQDVKCSCQNPQLLTGSCSTVCSKLVGLHAQSASCSATRHQLYMNHVIQHKSSAHLYL